MSGGLMSANPQRQRKKLSLSQNTINHNLQISGKVAETLILTANMTIFQEHDDTGSELLGLRN